MMNNRTMPMRLLAFVLALALVLPLTLAMTPPALADDPVYVLMNIPYDAFYAAELGAGDAAVALNVPDVLRQTEPLGADLYLELAEREDGSLFAGMFLVEDSGDRSQPGSDGITLRFYRQSKADVRISLAPVGEDDLIETDGVWNEKGYWSVPYLQEGTYFLLQ